MECERLSDTRKREALFIAWLKRNRAGKTLNVCRRKLRHLELSEDVLASFPSGMICIQRQYGEEFVHLEDRRWADEFAKAHQVMVLHHAQYFKQKKYLL
jgi:hypothetical protein